MKENNQLCVGLDLILLVYRFSSTAGNISSLNNQRGSFHSSIGNSEDHIAWHARTPCIMPFLTQMCRLYNAKN